MKHYLYRCPNYLKKANVLFFGKSSIPRRLFVIKHAWLSGRSRVLNNSVPTTDSFTFTTDV